MYSDDVNEIEQAMLSNQIDKLTAVMDNLTVRQQLILEIFMTANMDIFDVAFRAETTTDEVLYVAVKTSLITQAESDECSKQIKLMSEGF